MKIKFKKSGENCGSESYSSYQLVGTEYSILKSFETDSWTGRAKNVEWEVYNNSGMVRSFYSLKEAKEFLTRMFENN